MGIDLSNSICETGMVPLYRQDAEYRMPSRYLDEDVYNQALGSMIVVCTDAVILDSARETFYLAKRRHLPMNGLWIIGGRLRAGESEATGMRRNFNREVDLDIPEERFGAAIKMTRYVWSEREQEPRHWGSDNLSYNFAVGLTPDELGHAAASLDPEEYDAETGLQELGRAALSRLHSQGDLHPVIWDLYVDIFGH